MSTSAETRLACPSPGGEASVSPSGSRPPPRGVQGCHWPLLDVRALCMQPSRHGQESLALALGGAVNHCPDFSVTGRTSLVLEPSLC